ncbi:prolyl oligopeptidase family serine peptidase [Haliangium ochraceum]|uniref:prolyl oligopeptidase n=1 Tax=Haliangium ochraceum (strain DSM 14365 / JCM 11303 / SMP-2) TaxID=502025 RepID=D0LP45_HALO1|nr:prolyl oligopeptidase family serine peptidase [Haliangium ochraceum]ACY18871.1 Prolyl oligopeptidase [Haliangium ochraceum DSM 14365]
MQFLARIFRDLSPALVLLALSAGCGGNTNTTPTPEQPSATSDPQSAAEEAGFDYPQARRGDVVDDYHGVPVADPYRWLEDTDSDETRAWIEAQNQLTERYLATIDSRPAIRERLTELWDYDSYGIPEQVAGRYFFRKREGLQDQAVLYWMDGRDAEPQALLDPNTLSEDGTVALTRYELNNAGTHMAYGLQEAGSDWVEWRVREVASGQDLGDVVRWTKFGTVAWSPSGDGFFYGRYPEPAADAAFTELNVGERLFYHRLGTEQDADILIYERPDQPKWGLSPHVSDDGRYLLVTISKGTGPQNLVYYQALAQAGKRQRGAPVRGQMRPLVDSFQASYEFVANDGSLLWFLTDDQAPRQRLIAIDLNQPARANWREIIPQAEGTLRRVHLIGDRFFANYLEDAKARVLSFDRKGGQMDEIALPGIGSAYGFDGKPGDSETFYMFSSFTTPSTIYRYDLQSRTSEVFRAPEVDFDSSPYQVSQVFFESKDGTRVPMFLTHRRDITLDGRNPTLLFGYGGFNVPVTPTFSAARLMWLEMGGIYASANLRGGSEYGEEWHQAGTKLRKQNVFDDFIAAAEWLQAQGYTSPDKLVIEGRSNGGLLVGAAMTQRPDLFAVALPAVGVMDMLRFHKFTIGWAWVDDYGSAEDPEEFRALRAYSPYHNLRSAAYPATLVTTADHDDRVVPGHSFKFAAALQVAQTGAAPTMIRIDTRAGHGAGKPTSKLIEEVADILAFVAGNLDMRYPAAE